MSITKQVEVPRYRVTLRVTEEEERAELERVANKNAELLILTADKCSEEMLEHIWEGRKATTPGGLRELANRVHNSATFFEVIATNKLDENFSSNRLRHMVYKQRMHFAKYYLTVTGMIASAWDKMEGQGDSSLVWPS